MGRKNWAGLKQTSMADFRLKQQQAVRKMFLSSQHFIIIRAFLRRRLRDAISVS